MEMRADDAFAAALQLQMLALLAGHSDCIKRMGRTDR
jgi:hypothetical protein